jgi:hypothetical protein
MVQRAGPAISRRKRSLPMSPSVRPAAQQRDEPGRLPSKGERIELLRTETGVHSRGTVFYSDQLQILVKWDNGRSQSLRVGVDRYRIVE